MLFAVIRNHAIQLLFNREAKAVAEQRQDRQRLVDLRVNPSPAGRQAYVFYLAVSRAAVQCLDKLKFPIVALRFYARP